MKYFSFGGYFKHILNTNTMPEEMKNKEFIIPHAQRQGESLEDFNKRDRASIVDEIESNMRKEYGDRAQDVIDARRAEQKKLFEDRLLKCIEELRKISPEGKYDGNSYIIAVGAGDYMDFLFKGKISGSNDEGLLRDSDRDQSRAVVLGKTGLTRNEAEKYIGIRRQILKKVYEEEEKRFEQKNGSKIESEQVILCLKSRRDWSFVV